jgi:hypothetical protein
VSELALLMPPGVRAVVRGTFELMEVAEEEIKAGQRRHPRKAALINECFKQLCPPARFTELDEKLYRHHARELIERVAWTAGGDPAEQVPVRFATKAEILVCLMEQSLKAPLARQYAGLYEWLFVQVMGCTPPGEPVREPWSGATTALFVQLRERCNRRGL